MVVSDEAETESIDVEKSEKIDTTVNFNEQQTEEETTEESIAEENISEEETENKETETAEEVNNILEELEKPEEIKETEKLAVSEDIFETEEENFESLTEKQYQLFTIEEPEKEQTEGTLSEPETSEITEEIETEEANNISEETKTEEVEESEEIDEISEETTETAEPEIIEEVIEPKAVTIDYDKTMGKLETALEIRYSSLKLTDFPIKISNIPEGMTFPDELIIGNASIKIGEEIINNCYLKISSNESVKMFEIKHREFKLGLSVTLNDDTINAYGNVRYYEISSLIKYTRMLKVLEMFNKIFEGASITFKVNKLYGNINAEDRIESMRIKTIQNFFAVIEKSGYKFQIDKLPKAENIYYLLELTAALREKKVIETWCNFTFNNENIENINTGDFLTIKRVYKIDKHVSIEETITLKSPLDKNNIFKEKTAGYRKQCVIELKKINN